MSSPKNILHILTPADNPSAFDVNMAVDAGFDVIVPYTGLGLDDVEPIVQDAIFSRPPERYQATGVFIGGWDVTLAAQMLAKVRESMVPPFELSALADPNGAYTTSAALVAMIQRGLRASGQTLDGCRVKIFGGGPVGLCTAVLIAQRGGEPILVRLTDRARSDTVDAFCQYYDVSVDSVSGRDDGEKTAALADAQVVIGAAKAGIQVVSKALLETAADILVAADVNAVPPAGIEGVDVKHDGVEIVVGSRHLHSIGALGIGNMKYQVHHGLLKRMREADRAVWLDFPDAFELAESLA